MPVSKSGGQLAEKSTPSNHKVDQVKVGDYINLGGGCIITARENGRTGDMF